MNNQSFILNLFLKGVINKQQVVSWADRCIGKNTEQPNDLLKLSLSEEKPEHEIAHLLEALGGTSMPSGSGVGPSQPLVIIAKHIEKTGQK